MFDKNFRLTLILLLVSPVVRMEKPVEDSMELGTQSQSQMEISDSQIVAAAELADLETKQSQREAEAEVEREQKKQKFPTTLEGFKYKFNSEGQLRHIDTNEPFLFKVKSSNEYNQLHYEALGEVLTNHVYNLLETETNLKRVYVPVDAGEDEARSFVFMSEDALTNPDKLLLLIHGSGVVRAGQWARRLIMNDCLDSGTQIPFIKRAAELGYGVIVLNTNENTVHINNTVKSVKDNDSPVNHGLYIWDQFVSKSPAKNVAIIAHSYGGVVTVEMAIEKVAEFKERVFAIGLTDSVHNLVHQEVSKSLIKFFKKVACNWVSSKEELDTPVQTRYKEECPQVSAGTNKHEETSWNSFESIFTFLKEKYKSVTEKEEL